LLWRPPFIQKKEFKTSDNLDLWRQFFYHKSDYTDKLAHLRCQITLRLDALMLQKRKGFRRQIGFGFPSSKLMTDKDQYYHISIQMQILQSENLQTSDLAQGFECTKSLITHRTLSIR
jgi:hypothetical protein